MSANRKGKPFSDQVKLARTCRLMGHETSTKTRAKIAAAHTGKINGAHSAEWRAAIAAGHLRRGTLRRQLWLMIA
jgi:hypothetical protein